MGKSAPPPPDYEAAAVAQGDANKDAAVFNNNANRVNQYGPNGSSVWSMKPGADPLNPQVGDYTQTQAYSPEQQAIADQNNTLTAALLGTANNQLGKVNEAFNNTTTADTSGAYDWQGAPTPTTSSNGGGYQSPGGQALLGAASDGYGREQTAMLNPGASGYAMSDAERQAAAASGTREGLLGGNTNYTGYAPNADSFDALSMQQQSGSSAMQSPGGANPAMTGNLNYGGSDTGTDYNAGRDAVSNALLSRTEPQNQLDMQKLQTQLANQGVTPGSTAYNNAMDVLSRKSTDSRMAATLAGGQEQTRLNDMYRDNTQLGLNAQNQSFNQGLQRDQFGLSQQNQAYNQGLASAGFNNATRQSQIQEESYYENKDLNNTNALRTGNQVQAPQFGSYYTNNAQAAPIMDGATQQGAANASAQAGANATTDAVAGVAGAAIAAFAFNSDRRLKRNIRTIGRHSSGVRRVSWDWVDGSGSSSGVIAQELALLRPDAVIERSNGMLAVIYSAIGGF